MIIVSENTVYREVRQLNCFNKQNLGDTLFLFQLDTLLFFLYIYNLAPTATHEIATNEGKVPEAARVV